MLSDTYLRLNNPNGDRFRSLQQFLRMCNNLLLNACYHNHIITFSPTSVVFVIKSFSNTVFSGKIYSYIHILDIIYNAFYKNQPFAEVLQNRCSWKFRNILRKTAVLESIFNKVVGLRPVTFLKKRLQHRCFPVNIAKCFPVNIAKCGCFCFMLRGAYLEPYNGACQNG